MRGFDQNILIKTFLTGPSAFKGEILLEIGFRETEMLCHLLSVMG